MEFEGLIKDLGTQLTMVRPPRIGQWAVGVRAVHSPVAARRFPRRAEYGVRRWRSPSPEFCAPARGAGPRPGRVQRE